MKIGIIGCGFWAGYQVAAWREAEPNLQFVFCDRQKNRALAMAKRFSANAVYSDVNTMLEKEKLDLVDIITTPETHAALTTKVAQKGLPVICQKPMAPTLKEAEQMVDICRKTGVPFYIHENFRWQAPIRHLKKLINEGRIGTPFRARLLFNSGFPVFENQPNLMDLDRFIIADLGVHVLDVCRFLFGEVKQLYCINQAINTEIKGEDVSTLLLKMENGMSCTLEFSYASTIDYECFPQTLAEVEGDYGSIRLSPNFDFNITTKNGQSKELLEIPYFDWVHPDYAVVHSSMVAIQQNFLAGLKNGEKVETTGADNLLTTRLVYAAYESAESGKVVNLL